MDLAWLICDATDEAITVAKPKRKAPDKDTLRELYLKSGNQCAFPNCARVIINKDGIVVGQICHIEAGGWPGPRALAVVRVGGIA